MVLDVLHNAKFYVDRNPGMAKAFEFLLRPDAKDLPAGTYEIDGDRVYAMVQTNPGRPREGALLEAHREYIDIQLVLAGVDEMGWRPTQSCKQLDREYDPESDAMLYSDEPDAWITTRPGSFVIYYPEDAHMPNVSEDTLHKIVVKVPFADV